MSRLYLFVLFIFVLCVQEYALGGPLVSTPFMVQAQSAPAGSSNTEKTQKKKGLAPLRQEDAPEGSRVTITYNTALSDYSAYRQGDRFVVVIPKADAPRVRSNLRGRGFDGVQVEKRGDDAVLSFRIQPGVKARVDQQHNRLDVVFSAPEQQAATAASNRRPTADAPAQPTASKATQTAQPPGITPPPPLSNHNSQTATTAQPNNDRQSRDSSAEAAVTETQAGVTTATTAQSPAPSSENSGAAAQPTVDQRTTAQPTPAVSPAAASTSLSMFAARYWLPLFIALLLLLSAWVAIASRRHHAGQQPGNSNVNVNDNGTVQVEPALMPATTEAETTAVMQEETKLSSEETAAVPVIDEPSVSESAETEKEVPEFEAAGVLVPRADGEAATVVETGRALFKENPTPLDEEQSGIPAPILRHLGSEDANERSAGVLNLADLGSDEAFGRIGAAFDDPVQQVRDAAARSLFNVSADRVASFKRIMRESSPERRRRVGEAIFSSGMASEAISDLTSESGERAYDALLVLSLMARAGEVQSLIETIEEHPVTEVRLALVKLLALSGQQEIIQTFRYLATRDSLPIAVRSSIMEAIYQLNNPPPFDLSAT